MWRSFEKFCATGTGREFISGWGEEAAGVLAFCSARSHVLTASVQEGRSDYSGLLHKYYNLLAGRAEEQSLQDGPGTGPEGRGVSHKDNGYWFLQVCL